MRILGVVLVSILVLIGLTIGFIVLTISNSKDCDQLVIDTYEIHSNIDIPDVDFINCYYNEEEEVRISIYKLNADVNYYIRKYEFKPILFPADSCLKGFNMLAQEERPIHDELFFLKGQKWGRSWNYLVERETGRLWTELVF